MYKIAENLECDLAKITPKTLRVLKNLGFLNRGTALTAEQYKTIQVFVGNALNEDINVQSGRDILAWLRDDPQINEVDLYLDDDKLRLLIETVFQTKDFNTEDVDMQVVIQGTYDLLGKLNPSSFNAPNLLEILNTLMSKMEAVN